MITPSSTNPTVTEVGDYIFRVCFIDPFQGYVMAKFARENLKVDQGGGAHGHQERLLAGAGRGLHPASSPSWAGRSSPSEAYSKGDTDFRAQLTAHQDAEAGGHLRPRLLHRRGDHRPAGAGAGHQRPAAWAATAGTREKLFELGGERAARAATSPTTTPPEDPSPRCRSSSATTRRSARCPTRWRRWATTRRGWRSRRCGGRRTSPARPCATPSPRPRTSPGVTGTITLDEKRNAVKPAVVLEVGAGKYKYITTVHP